MILFYLRFGRAAVSVGAVQPRTTIAQRARSRVGQAWRSISSPLNLFAYSVTSGPAEEHPQTCGQRGGAGREFTPRSAQAHPALHHMRAGAATGRGADRPAGRIRVTAYAGRAVRAGSAPRTRCAARFGPRRAAPFGYARPDKGPFARAGKQPSPACGRPGAR